AAFIKGVARGMAASWHLGLGTMIARALGDWELYAFAVATLLVMLLVQSAFQSGPIRWSLPALTATNPIASVFLGAWLLGEHVRSTPLALLGACVGLAVVVGGIMTLSSSNLITGGVEAGQDDATGAGAGVAGEDLEDLEVAVVPAAAIVTAPAAASASATPVSAASAATATAASAASAG
ncbi:MAG TPA: hypothetical protein VKA05_06625, partial [Acidimicrobiales bacterium]|nr:hypothetical protein [Acidimicrobiales bacterium]